MIIKVCGMREPQNIRAIERLGIDMMGFIFHPASPRYVGRRPDYLPDTATRTGVFVDADVETILRRVEEFGLQAVQLHGGETPDMCRALRRLLPPHTTLIKAVPIASEEDLKRTADYADTCDYILFETRCTTYGGSGRRFDWSLLDRYRGPLPFILSGGIGPDAVDTIAALRHPMMAGIDLNSRFETAPALKDAAKIRQFINELNQRL